MDARGLTATERVPASRKLGAERAAELLEQAQRLIVAKGKKLTRFDRDDGFGDDALQAMLGPTGNLRAPTLVAGDTVLVGFNEDAYADVFDG